MRKIWLIKQRIKQFIPSSFSIGPPLEPKSSQFDGWLVGVQDIAKQAEARILEYLSHHGAKMPKTKRRRLLASSLNQELSLQQKNDECP